MRIILFLLALVVYGRHRGNTELVARRGELPARALPSVLFLVLSAASEERDLHVLSDVVSENLGIPLIGVPIALERLNQIIHLDASAILATDVPSVHAELHVQRGVLSSHWIVEPC